MVYPHFDLYPSKACDYEDNKRITVKLPARYPAFALCQLCPLLFCTAQFLNAYADPAVYPYFELWPSVCHSELSPLSSQANYDSHVHVIKHETRSITKQNFPGAPRSHHELHDTVFPDGVVSSPGRTSSEQMMFLRTAPRTHEELHQSVFPDSIVSTPSGTSSEVTSTPYTGFVHPQQSRDDSQGIAATDLRRISLPHRVPPASSMRTSTSRSRSGSVSLRTQILVAAPPTPSPNRELPSPPSSAAADRGSTAVDLTTSAPHNKVSPTQVRALPSPPSGPSRSSSNRYSRPTPPGPLDVRNGRVGAPQLSPVQERYALSELSMLSRANSMALPPKTVNEANAGLDRAHSLSGTTSTTRLPVRRRDSLVLQRVKAYNATCKSARILSAFLTSLTTATTEPEIPISDTLSRFPMPPRPSLPPVPPVSKLNRSKFPFA